MSETLAVVTRSTAPPHQSRDAGSVHPTLRADRRKAGTPPRALTDARDFRRVRALR